MSVPSFVAPAYTFAPGNSAGLRSVNSYAFGVKLKRSLSITRSRAARFQSHTFRMVHISFNCCQEFNANLTGIFVRYKCFPMLCILVLQFEFPHSTTVDEFSEVTSYL